jgi:hypothetical protein
MNAFEFSLEYMTQYSETKIKLYYTDDDTK